VVVLLVAGVACTYHYKNMPHPLAQETVQKFISA